MNLANTSTKNLPERAEMTDPALASKTQAKKNLVKPQVEETFINTTPELITAIKEKNKAGQKLTLEEMVIWNASRLNSWAYCTKHKKKYRFHQGCKLCNDTCNYCGDIVTIKQEARHHETCKDMPKGIKKTLEKKMQKNISLGQQLQRLKALPDTQQNRDRIASIRRQMVKD